MDKAQVDELASQHAALHARIDEEENRTHPDEDLLHRLKKEKLRLKDELAGHFAHKRGRLFYCAAAAGQQALAAG